MASRVSRATRHAAIEHLNLSAASDLAEVPGQVGLEVGDRDGFHYDQSSHFGMTNQVLKLKPAVVSARCSQTTSGSNSAPGHAIQSQRSRRILSGSSKEQQETLKTCKETEVADDDISASADNVRRRSSSTKRRSAASSARSFATLERP